MGEGKRGKPSSELERLEIFEQLATEYFAMVELFTADGEPVAPSSAERERRHWLELFRAALLRKFIVREEHVSLKLVLRALHRCNYSADATVAAGIDDVVALFSPEMLVDRPAVTAPAPNDPPELIEDVLYGRLLHGDADRFRRSGWSEDYARLSAVAAERFEAEHALRRALEVVRYGRSHGLLQSPGGQFGPSQ